MIKKLKTFLVAAVMFMIASEAQAYTFTPLDVPGASYTYALGINDSGDVVGYSQDSSYYKHSFIYDGSTGTLTTLDDVPGDAYGINDSGDVVGFYTGSDWYMHGFVYEGSTGTYTMLSYPGATNTYAYGINDSGDVVGRSYTISTGSWQAFIYDGSANPPSYTTLGYPGATNTFPYGINDSGDIVGRYFMSGWHNFIYDASANPLSYTTLDVDVEGATNIQALGINDSGDIVGRYSDSSGLHGFVYDGSTGTSTTLDVPGAIYTIARGINDSGEVTGIYQDSNGLHGFIATVLTAVPDVTIDIKPQACPNPLNIKSKGVLPVAILGTYNFDVNTIDVNSITLNGVAPIKSAYENVAAPAPSDLDPCDCLAVSGDGFEDLVLKFDKQAIIETLEEVQDGDEIQLTLTGNLLDGTAIEGLDCVVIKGKKKKGSDDPPPDDGE